MKRLMEGTHQTRSYLTFTNSPLVCFIEKGNSSPLFFSKHAHYLPGVVDKVRESSRLNHVVLIEIKCAESKKLGLEILCTLKIKEFHLQF